MLDIVDLLIIHHILCYILLLINLTCIHHPDFLIPLSNLSLLLLLPIMVHLLLYNLLLVFMLLLP